MLVVTPWVVVIVYWYFQSYTLGSNDNCISCSDSHNLISVIREIVMVSCLVVVIVKVTLWDIIIIVVIVWVVIFVISITFLVI